MDKQLDIAERYKSKMLTEGLAPEVADIFLYYYKQIQEGFTGTISENIISPLNDCDIADYRELGCCAEAGRKAIRNTAIIKLNGGLGTGMGLKRAKSLIKVKKDLSFLDIIVRQVQKQRETFHASIPLVLMNSFNTDADTKDALQKYGNINAEIPCSFLQHKYPKIKKDDLSPAVSPEDPRMEWNPPGHGDIYTALVTSGILGLLLDGGYRYAFISNSDNLGAVLDIKILGYLSEKKLPFLMEVARRTEMDRKGGHLARQKDGGLILREAAQCPAEDAGSFQDIDKYRFFNTNTLWVDLIQLKAVLDNNNNILPLPMIRNEKKLNPRDDNSADVYQIETAMGSAISVFKSAGAVLIPKVRFAPVKKCNDLLTLRSDRYVLLDDYRMIPNPDAKESTFNIELDPQYYKKIDQLDERFPGGPPSLMDCESLRVEGDFLFGKNVKISGKVKLVNESERQETIPDGTVISE